ncbi:MAG TPA: DUF262 domain-containing protein [Caldisericia bacterium]|nr:DUF262 domain-containing protein [Caldisericia bacterium]
MSNKIELKSISELSGMKFFIPDYQRGYRWTEELVNDLLEDIDEFINENHSDFYCIQPLVVKKNIIERDESCKKLNELSYDDNNLIDSTEKLIDAYSQWEIIDGQQRLTTIFILLKYLCPDIRNYYSIEYETRKGSNDFLEKIDEKSENDSLGNIDYYHMYKAYEKISEFFVGDKGKENCKKEFLETLLYKVKFIWYETINEDPIKVFTRLNIGKISLTNAELVKALFLNKSNFKTSDSDKIRLQQQEIASEWDKIEYTLQSDEFWLFLNEKGYDKPTRIDFILDFICEKNLLEVRDYNNNVALGNDEYRTFRYFYTWFKKEGNPNILECWSKIKTIFQTFNEWFNDLELYHYIGFLVEQRVKITEIHYNWIKNGTKQQFIDGYIKKLIRDKIMDCSNLEKEYDLDAKSKKTQCRPLLLLHNIQTVINQGKELIKNEKYKLPVFYKFPFYLFKKEAWDIEHIDSYTENSLDDKKDQKEWLKAAYFDVSDEELKGEIKSFINYLNSCSNNKEKEGKEHESEDLKEQTTNSNEGSKLNDEDKSKFEDLQKKIIDSIKDSKLNDEDKNKIWNFCLLDASTNRSYGNSIFSAKRRAIIGKDQGKKILIDDELNIKEVSGEIAFIPPCTKNIFLKYYNASTNNLLIWSKEDAQAYKANINDVLNEFLLKTENNEKQ